MPACGVAELISIGSLLAGLAGCGTSLHCGWADLAGCECVGFIARQPHAGACVRATPGDTQYLSDFIKSADTVRLRRQEDVGCGEQASE